MKRFAQSGLFAVLLLLSPLYTASKVHAEESSSSTAKPISILTVSPIMSDLAVKPGESIQKTLTVTNQARIPLPMKAYTRAFIATDEYGGSDYPDEQNPDSVQNWFKIKDPDFIIQPQETKTLNVTINVPAGARPGGHYATLFVESLLPKEVLSETSLYLSSRIGALFFFVVAGDLVEKGQIREFKTSKFWQSGPVEFDVAFRNEGNVDLRPKSTLTISDWQGKVIHTIEDDGQRTLPEKTRRWKLKWDKKWLLGRYTAKLETKNDLDAKPQITQIQFYAFPLYNALSLTALILFIYLFFIKGRHRLKKAINVFMGKEAPAEPDAKEAPKKKTKVKQDIVRKEAKPVKEEKPLSQSRAIIDFGITPSLVADELPERRTFRDKVRKTTEISTPLTQEVFTSESTDLPEVQNHSSQQEVEPVVSEPVKPEQEIKAVSRPANILTEAKPAQKTPRPAQKAQAKSSNQKKAQPNRNKKERQTSKNSVPKVNNKKQQGQKNTKQQNQTKSQNKAKTIKNKSQKPKNKQKK